jgi:flagellar motility protein MotE (MotC chaperone)
MIRFFQSSWLTALVGCLLYLGTTLAVIRPEKFAAAQLVPTDRSGPDDPSWKFKNPEFDQWIAQMKDEKETLALREQQLGEWQSRLDAESQEISIITQTVSHLQSDFDKNIIRFRAQETDNVKHQAKLIAAMSPAGAAALFNELADDEAVRVLFIMKTDEASAILDMMSKLGKPEARRAAILTGRLHQVLPQATNAVSTAAP